jgi:hypothetical protein
MIAWYGDVLVVALGELISQYHLPEVIAKVARAVRQAVAV